MLNHIQFWKRHPDSPDVVALPPVIYTLGFLVGYACDIWWGWSFNIGPAVALAWLLVGGGGMLGLWAAWEFRRAGTNIPPNQPATALVTGGPFRNCRNPMYVALALMHTGLAALLDAPAALLALLVIIPLMHWGVVLREEAYLTAKFGEAYERYCQTAKRYF